MVLIRNLILFPINILYFIKFQRFMFKIKFTISAENFFYAKIVEKDYYFLQI